MKMQSGKFGCGRSEIPRAAVSPEDVVYHHTLDNGTHSVRGKPWAGFVGMKAPWLHAHPCGPSPVSQPLYS